MRLAFLPQIGQRLGVLRHAFDAERLQSVQGHDPRRHAGGKRLGEERTERLVFPPLHVAGAPVIHDDEAQDVLFRLRGGDTAAHIHPAAHVEAHFELKVQFAAGAPLGRFRVGGLDLALGADDRRARGHHRVRAAVITNRHPAVVGEKRVALRAEHLPHIAGMVDAAIEVHVRHRRDRHLQVGLLQRDHRPLLQLLPGAQGVVVVPEQVENHLAQVAQLLPVHVDERLQDRKLAVINQPSFAQRQQVQRVGANCGDHRLALPLDIGEAEGDVLNRERAVGRDINPGFRTGGDGESLHELCLKKAARPSRGSATLQEPNPPKIDRKSWAALSSRV